MYRKYRRRSYRESTSPLEMLFEIIWGVGALVGFGLFKLFKYVWNRSKAKGSFKTNSFSPIIVPAETIHTATQEIQKESRYGLRENGLMTTAEREFLIILEKIVGDLYHIEPQVQLSRIVTPLDSNKDFINYRDFNRIKAKSIDFVLYDKEYKPYLAIELDDKTHRRFDRMKRDHFVDEVMKGAGLRMVHVPFAWSYDTEKLKTLILPNINLH